MERGGGGVIPRPARCGVRSGLRPRAFDLDLCSHMFILIYMSTRSCARPAESTHSPYRLVSCPTPSSCASLAGSLLCMCLLPHLPRDLSRGPHSPSLSSETGWPLTDITDIDMPPSMALTFPNGTSDMMHLGLSLSPPEGPYHPGTFHFSISIPDGYPHSPPKVHCNTKVFHPNIDLEGHVCLNILRQDWKPVLTLSAVLYGLQLLFLEPNADDPLNSEAAEALKAGGVAWERLVTRTLRGGYVGGTRFDKVI